MFKLRKLISLILLVCTLSINQPVALIPVTGNLPETVKPDNAGMIKSVDTFSKTLLNGNSQQIVGVFVANTLAFPIQQQPAGNAAFVSTQADTVTQFAAASNYGSIGLIAHNNLAGAQFSDLKVDERIILVYGDGSQQQFEITEIDEYQALSPYSPYSNFVDLDVPETTLSATSLFMKVYNPDDRLVMQTCIEKDGVDSWGRLFIIAEPVEIELPLYY